MRERVISGRERGMHVFHGEEHSVGAFFFDPTTGVISLSLFRFDPSSITAKNASGDASVVRDLYTSCTIPPLTANLFSFFSFSENDIALAILKLIFFPEKIRMEVKFNYGKVTMERFPRDLSIFTSHRNILQS